MYGPRFVEDGHNRYLRAVEEEVRPRLEKEYPVNDRWNLLRRLWNYLRSELVIQKEVAKQTGYKNLY